MATFQPSISIIVPIYKVQDYLSECIESILSQTFTDFELILVDDGSPDNCPAMCDAYAQKDFRIKVIHKKNGGLMSAWKAGFEISTGQYIGFVDSDDWIAPQMYEELYKVIRNHNADLVQCDFIHESTCPRVGVCKTDRVYIFEQSEIITQLLPRMLTLWETDGFIFSNSRWNKLIKRDLIANNLKYCDERISIGEDLNIMLPVVLDCRKIVCIPGCYYHYRCNENSITSLKYKKGFWQQQLLLMQRVQSVIEAKNVKVQELCDKLFNFMTFKAIYNEWHCPEPFIKKLKKMITIARQNPAKGSLSKLRLKKLDRRFQFIYLCCRLLRPFVGSH